MDAMLAAFLVAIPSIVGALLLLVIGWIVAGIVGGLVTRLLRKVGLDTLAAKAGIVAAASQIGVAATLINILFTGVVAAVALAFALAFGLGGREEAAKALRDWRGQASSAMERVDTAPAPARGDGKPDSLIEERMRRDQLSRQS